MASDVQEPAVAPQAPDADAMLLDRARRGDAQAMGTLFDRYAKFAYSVAMRVLRDGAASDDVLQEIFLALWRRPVSLVASNVSVGGWLALSARNRAIDMLRRKRPSEQSAEIRLMIPCNLASEAERSSLMQRTRTIIRRLPPEQRKTLEMAFFDGLTHTEIAEMTGDPLPAVKTRIRTSLTTLRKDLQA